MSQSYLYIYLNWTDPETGALSTFRRLLGDATGPMILTLGRAIDNSVSLADRAVSAYHAQLEFSNNTLTLKDLNSANGTLVDGKPVSEMIITSGMRFQIGPYNFEVVLAESDDISERDHPSDLQPPADAPREIDQTTFYARDELEWLVSETRDKAQPQSDDLPGTPSISGIPVIDFFTNFRVDITQLPPEKQPAIEIAYLSLGGGLGSFAWVDRLIVSGVSPSDVAVIGMMPDPTQRFHRLCNIAQIPDHERLRANSRETLGNIWGWPGYGLRECRDHLKDGAIRQAISVLWQLTTAPLLTERYYPRLSDFVEEVNREAARIGWSDMWHFGHIKAIRQTTDNRYLIAYSPTGSPDDLNYQLAVATYVHIAFGSPGIRFEADLQAYRTKTGDFRKVVNIYEDHEHIYRDLRDNGGDVLLRGRGIAASRIVHRLAQERSHNPNINIIHMQDNPTVEGQRYGLSRRRVANHQEYQSLAWPEAVYAGDLYEQYYDASPDQRHDLLALWGGVTTIPRRDWLSIINKGLSEGWYQIRFGHIERVMPAGDGSVTTVIQGNSDIEETTRISTDYIIDATDMSVDIKNQPVINDLLSTYALPRTRRGGICVSEQFEIEELRNDKGRVFMSGVMTAGSPYPAPATFAGLQVAAQRSITTLRQLKALDIHRLSGLRSLTQWLRWLGDVKPS